MSDAQTVSVNRAPVLMLWAAEVAERMGYDEREALSLGKGLAVLNAQSKGQRLGIFKPGDPDQGPPAKEPPKSKRKDRETFVDLCGRPVPAVATKDGLRAVVKGETISASSTERYLRSKFGDNLEPARSAMRDRAKSFRPPELAAAAYGLYERFRPAIPPGQKGWGSKGVLDLNLVRSLAPRKKAKTRTKAKT